MKVDGFEVDEKGYVIAPSFFKHPVLNIKANNVLSKQNESLRQEDYFKMLTHSIYITKGTGPLLFLGIDEVFMQRYETLVAIKNTLDDRGYFPNVEHRITPEFSLSGIHCIVGPETDTSFFGDLREKITITRTNYDTSLGLIVFGANATSFWDKTRLTYNPDEVKNGVIFRDFVLSPEITGKVARNFARYESGELQSMIGRKNN